MKYVYLLITVVLLMSHTVGSTYADENDDKTQSQKSNASQEDKKAASENTEDNDDDDDDEQKSQDQVPTTTPQPTAVPTSAPINDDVKVGGDTNAPQNKAEEKVDKVQPQNQGVVQSGREVEKKSNVVKVTRTQQKKESQKESAAVMAFFKNPQQKNPPKADPGVVQGEDESPEATVTQPIEAPGTLVRGATNNSYYDHDTLSEDVTLYSLLTAFGLIGLGTLVMKSHVFSRLLSRRSGSLPLPQKEPFTIPYINTRFD